MKKHRNLGFGRNIISSLISSILTIGVSIYLFFSTESLQAFAALGFVLGVVAFVYYLSKFVQSKK